MALKMTSDKFEPEPPDEIAPVPAKVSVVFATATDVCFPSGRMKFEAERAKVIESVHLPFMRLNGYQFSVQE